MLNHMYRVQEQRHIRGIILIELLPYGTSYQQNCVWIILLIFLLMSQTISIITSSKTLFLVMIYVRGQVLVDFRRVCVCF